MPSSRRCNVLITRLYFSFDVWPHSIEEESCISPTVLLALKRPVFKVARKEEECMYEIYTTRPHLEILIVEGLCPRAQSKKKNAIRSRSGRRVAPRSPFLSRNYEIASLKDPHRASARSIHSIFFSSIDVVTHRRPRLSREEIVLPISSPALLFPSASSRNRQRIIPSSLPAISLLSLSLSLSSRRTSLFLLSSRFYPRSLLVLFSAATTRDRPRLAQVTAIGNFNARPVLPNDFIQRNGCRGAEWRPRSMPKLGIEHSTLVYLRRSSSCRLRVCRYSLVRSDLFLSHN